MKVNSRILGRIEKYSPSIFEKSPIERNQLVYVPRFLCEASLPKKLINTSEWQRTTRSHTYTIMSPSDIGVPGGAYSRLIFIRINTLARLTKSRQLNIGSNFAEFMGWMGLCQAGGINGNIYAFKEHFIRCINSVIRTVKTSGNEVDYAFSTVIDRATVQNINKWNWQSELILSQSFFEESQNSAPTDLGALICLGPGTLRMDIFNYLVRRLFYLKKETLVSWNELRAMFSNPGVSNWNFRQNFEVALKQALIFYPEANIRATKKGLVLLPSPMLIQPAA